MWTIHHIKYASLHKDKLVLYFRAPGGATLASNYQEDGLHYSGVGKRDAPVISDWKAEFVQFPDNPPVVSGKGKVV